MTYQKFRIYNPTMAKKKSTVFLFRYEFPRDFTKVCMERGFSSDDDIKNCLAAEEFKETCASNNFTAVLESLSLYVEDFFDSDILKIT